MLVLLRILFGGALIYEIVQGVRSAPGATEAGDLTGAFYLAICVGLGILNAMVWAPYLGAKVSGPLTGMITESTYVERTNWVLRLIRWFDVRGFRRTTLLLCFLEGVRHPSAPAAYVTGLKNARTNSWLEKVFAREVFRYSNAQNCVQAYLTLRRHGIDPRPHPSQEVNIVLLSLERPPRPEAEIIAVPSAPKAAPLKRNLRIRLFKQKHEDQEEAIVAHAEAPIPEPASALGPTDSAETEVDLVPQTQPAATSQPALSFAERVMAFLRAH
jgi:hypothetical protein